MAFVCIIVFAFLFGHGLSLQFEGIARQSFRGDLCEQVMSFGNKDNGNDGQPTANNLGDEGPETGEQSIRYSGIFPSAETQIDLVVTAETDYTAKNSDNNGLHNGVYGQVNIQSGTDVTLRYQFQDSISGAAVEAPPFIITFFDFDSAKLGTAVESMTAYGFSNYTTSADTELDVVTSSDGSLTITATQHGTGADNPTNKRNLTTQQANRAISLTFPALSEFTVVFSATESGKKKPGGRNMLFGAASSLDCPVVPTCDEFACPASSVQIPYAEYTNGNDSSTCCAEKASCIEHTCSEGLVLILEAHETYCEGTECTSTDDAQCCEDQSSLCSRMSLSLSSTLVNNLGGQGPDSSATAADETLTFGNVFPSYGSTINLVISALTPYNPYNVSRNGVKDVFGVVNLATQDEVELFFSFVNAETGLEETVPGFLFSVYDLDISEKGAGEYVFVSGYNGYKTTETTELYVEPENEASGYFFSSEIGHGEDNPTTLANLTATQKDRLVSFEFPYTSSFRLTFGSSEDGGNEGRNIHFSGSSPLYCSQETNISLAMKRLYTHWNHGPRVGSNGGAHCSKAGRVSLDQGMSLSQAQAACNRDPACNYLWSHKCDGSWIACDRSMPEESAGDRSSCTMFRKERKAKSFKARPSNTDPQVKNISLASKARVGFVRRIGGHQVLNSQVSFDGKSLNKHWKQGPRVGSSGSKHCLSKGRVAFDNRSTLLQAQVECDRDPACHFLWSHNCDGSWVTCDRSIPEENAGDETACTWLRQKL